MKIAIIILGFGLLCANAYAANIQSTATPALQTSAGEAKHKMPGDDFFAANKNKPGVVTLPDGLQYRVIEKGTGKRPSGNDAVTVNYAGTLINGTEFDSSYKRGIPATFRVAEVIAGWTEVLKLMNEGSTWEVYIPSSLAYGEQGAPPLIGPNQTLIFKINLIKVINDSL